MNFHIAKAAATTGALLNTMVLEQLRVEGVADPGPDVHVCYGVGYNGPHTKVLNAGCSRLSKLEQGRRLREGLGPGALDVLNQAQAEAFNGPMFARKLVHSKGRDIRVVLEPWQVAPLVVAGYGFFTPHVPSVREFRTWVYRKRHLGTYEKALNRPAQCLRLGRNYDNGFDFNGIENDQVPEGLKDISRRAIAALGLDFGAVDVLLTPDGQYVVLEVNSAPGVAHERRRVITGLAHRIARWVVNGCPARGGD